MVSEKTNHHNNTIEVLLPGNATTATTKSNKSTLDGEIQLEANAPVMNEGEPSNKEVDRSVPDGKSETPVPETPVTSTPSLPKPPKIPRKKITSRIVKNIPVIDSDDDDVFAFASQQF